MSHCRALLLLVLLPTALRADKLVVARSSVVGDYLEKRRVDGKLQPQRYVFMAGRFLAGNRRDRSLERFSFRALASRLAQDLKRQEFYPAESLRQADLLLVVHWGATAGRNNDLVALAQGFDTLATINLQAEESRSALDQAIAAGDFEGAASARDSLHNLANSARAEQQSLLREERNESGADTAALLGFTSEMSRQDGTLAEQERRKTLFELTREECYFVVVMAYDAPALVETRRLKRVWSLRVSINTAGVNFPEALDRIAEVSGHHFGQPQQGLTFAYPRKPARTATVRIEDIVVFGTVEP